MGLDFANNNRLVTFGVFPSKPETGFGYIKAEKPFIRKKIEGQNIEEFIEKPNLSTAKEYLKDMRFTWNSGIFMFKAKTVLQELKKFAPEIVKSCKDSILESKLDLDFQRIDKDAFEKCPNLSIDVAVMEKTFKGVVIPLDAGWSDIGNWKSVWEDSHKDQQGNSVEGKTIVKNSRNCYFLFTRDTLLNSGRSIDGGEIRGSLIPFQVLTGILIG